MQADERLVQLDVIEQIPDPETIKDMIAEAVRRLELLRSLLKVSQHKAAYKPRGKGPRDETALRRA